MGSSCTKAEPSQRRRRSTAVPGLTTAGNSSRLLGRGRPRANGTAIAVGGDHVLPTFAPILLAGPNDPCAGSLDSQQSQHRRDGIIGGGGSDNPLMPPTFDPLAEAAAADGANPDSDEECDDGADTADGASSGASGEGTPSHSNLPTAGGSSCRLSDVLSRSRSSAGDTVTSLGPATGDASREMSAVSEADGTVLFVATRGEPARNPPSATFPA